MVCAKNIGAAHNKLKIPHETVLLKKTATQQFAGVTGECGTWREKLPDAESAVGADAPKVWANARTCPVHAVLGRTE